MQPRRTQEIISQPDEQVHAQRALGLISRATHTVTRAASDAFWLLLQCVPVNAAVMRQHHRSPVLRILAVRQLPEAVVRGQYNRHNPNVEQVLRHVDLVVAAPLPSSVGRLILVM
jgi:hypothetical protein